MDNNMENKKNEDAKLKKEKWFSPSNIIAIVLAILAIIATVVITNYFRDKKELRITLLANEKIIQKSKNSDNINNLKILYNETELINPAIIKFSVKNTGNVDITKDDFLSPISITLDNIIIYDCFISSIDNQIESSINDSTSIKNNSIIIDNFYLLKNEEFTITLITEEIISDYEINARILGINEIKKFMPHENKFFFAMSIIGLIFSILMFSWQIFTIRTKNYKVAFFNKKYIPIIGFIIIFYSILIVLNGIYLIIYK